MAHLLIDRETTILLRLVWFRRADEILNPFHAPLPPHCAGHAHPTRGPCADPADSVPTAPAGVVEHGGKHVGACPVGDERARAADRRRKTAPDRPFASAAGNAA